MIASVEPDFIDLVGRSARDAGELLSGSDALVEEDRGFLFEALGCSTAATGTLEGVELASVAEGACVSIGWEMIANRLGAPARALRRAFLALCDISGWR